MSRFHDAQACRNPSLLNRFYSPRSVGNNTICTHQGTPFFQGFSSILFGRPALSGLQEKLREVAALNTLSDFFETFGFLIPDALLHRRSSGANSRQRRFTVHVTLWAFLAQTLAPETSCRDIVRKVQVWWLLRTPKSIAGSSSTAAYTKAPQRIDPKTIRSIGEHLIERLERRVPSSQLWLGRRVRVVDGTTVSMPDTPENQEKYPQPSSQTAGCGFPRRRRKTRARPRQRRSQAFGGIPFAPSFLPPENHLEPHHPNHHLPLQTPPHHQAQLRDLQSPRLHRRHSSLPCRKLRMAGLRRANGSEECPS